MSYENLARKYRPQLFENVAGQDSVTRTLTNSLKLGRAAHAYLFFGPRGCGKTTMARILAKALNCHKGLSPEPCNKCISCREITEGKALDVLEIDAASHTQVDKVREVIIETVALVPSRDRYKIFILDEAHMLSTASFNALLKTIEEPPPHVVFMLATTEQMKIPATISSRCQGFRFKPLTKELISERLKEVAKREKLNADAEAMEMIAGSSSGSMRDALTLLDRTVSFSRGKIDGRLVSELAGQVREDLLKSVALAVLERNGALLHESFEAISAEGYDVLALLRDLRNIFASVFLSASGFSKSGGRLESELSKDRPAAVFARLARRVNRVIDETRNSDSQAVVAELGLFSLIEAPADLEGWVRRLESLESRLKSSAGGVLPETQRPAADDCRLHETGAKRRDPEKHEASSDGKESGPAVNHEDDVFRRGGEEAANSGAGTSDGALWRQLLEGLSGKNPILHGMLASCRVLFEGRDKWRLVFANSFHLETVERSRARIESVIKELSGRPVSLVLEKGASSDGHPRMEEISGGEAPDARPAPSGQPAAEVQWRDISGDGVLESDPGIKKILKVFPGKVRKIPKK